MISISKSKIIIAIAVILVVTGSLVLWNKLASTTKIALVNFQQFQTTSLIKSNTDNFVEFKEVSLENLNKLGSYDFVLGFGMGLNISTEQRIRLQHLADKGVPLYIYAPTNIDNNICNLDSIQKATVSEYLGNGNKRNYRNLAHYIRQYIDKKTFFITPADSVAKSAMDVLYHLDDEVACNTVSEYESYLKQNNFYREGGAKIAIVGGLNDPFSGNKDNLDSLIVSFQQAGMNIYPVSSYMKRLEFLKEINPDAVVHLAHGRMAMGQADAAVEWLKIRNIPIFAPLTLLQTKEEWLNDSMGMFGGFMSQSIVTPELDGAIYPYVVNIEEVDKEGLYLFKAIPERLRNFTRIVNNFISLQRKSNAEKKLSIYYFKAPGHETLTAQGLETIPSLYNLLKRLKAEGYKVDNLPGTVVEFGKILRNPLSLTPDPSSSEKIAIEGVVFGNIALIPQPLPALGGDTFTIIHGAKTDPPQNYIDAYLWSQDVFKADALLHFGTHGSLEFTPQKQMALSNEDWSDRLVGTIPHFYYYTIGNVGESMMAKRRSYATTISYLTPPFMESNMRSQFGRLEDRIRDYYKTSETKQPQASLAVKKIAVEMGLHRELRLDSVLTNPYTATDIERLENFAEEIANEKMTGRLYTTGVPYASGNIHSSVLAMSADPIAYSLAALNRQRGRITDKELKNKALFTQRYLDPSKALVNRILNGTSVDTALICSTAGISKKELQEAKKIVATHVLRMPAMTQTSGKEAPKSGGHPAWIPKIGKRPDNTVTIGKLVQTGKPSVPQPEYTKEQKERARTIIEVERTINNITVYRKALEQSPETEMKSLLNALNGGYIAPSSGGDAVANPMAVPTGRNLYSINAEATPSEVAWDKGVSLVNATLEQYKQKHGDYPQKVSYTFWSSEFIESEGVTIAQVLYMLGVEPVRDSFDRVSDIQLIPSETLGRPRIDVVVQTSGQFRDLAASRLSLISRAVEMAAQSEDDRYENRVATGTVETERLLVDKGVSPKEARELSVRRVFGGVNGMYGTGIQGMVTSGDKWEDEKEIADTYIHNMGAVYSNEKEWGQFKAELLRAVLQNTDVVVQPRQSNTWGALSLDHVYEFMGGMNLAVRSVTGKDPEAYFADYRNRNNVRMQELKEAIGVESRSTLFNPAYIKEVMKGNASSASQITEIVTNTYAWNVMKPDVIDREMWDRIYSVYVKDSEHLGVQDFFKRENPSALQEITAVMLETARKGMWRANGQQLADIAQLHTALVKEFGVLRGGFSGNNAKLQDFITKQVPQDVTQEYVNQIQNMKVSTSEKVKNGMLLKKETSLIGDEGEENSINGVVIVSAILAAFVLLLVLLRKKRKNE
ncbi:Aerobic cobaltochelatase subunit CobN [termite gut metagenome]|uniref:Aerobic cobaltochelatase subunit CobN n=1 Tax=termite gut metagenome TaxID=433724 RepID=A0A5J4SD78_9ZZZZ